VLEKTGLTKPIEIFLKDLEIENDIELQFELERVWADYKLTVQEEAKRNGTRKIT